MPPKLQSEFSIQEYENIFNKYNNKERANLFARDANINEATNSPTINAEDNTPSSALLRSKSPL